MIKFTLLL